MKKMNLMVCILLLYSFYADADERQDPEEYEEVMDQLLVIGDRIPLNTETEQKTQKILDLSLMGNDPMSGLYALPGIVQEPHDMIGGTGGPAIRGSSPEDNAYYIDFIPTGFVFHSFLGDSVFNENLIHKFDLKPAAFGVGYGEATGGVIDIRLRDPRNQDFSGTFDWSMLETGIMLESGISEGSAFYVSYQESLLHIFLGEGEDEDDPGFVINNVPRSNDYQFKYQWLINQRQRLTFGLNGAKEFVAVNIGAESEVGRTDPDEVGDAHFETDYDSQGVSWEVFGQGQSYFNLAISRLKNLFLEMVNILFPLSKKILFGFIIKVIT